MKMAMTLLMLTLFPTAALGQEVNAPAGHMHVPGMTHGGNAGQTAPLESGQSAFAAIQEIVEILETDPATDWSKVDIEALRQHLIDMDNVTLAARVEAAAVDGGARFSVTGPGEVGRSIRRMVSAHAAAMDGAGAWRFVAADRPDGAMLTVTAPDAADAVKIRALGFAGVMARGMHHQQHHLMIASGASPHR